MPAVTRQGDSGKRHDSCPTTAATGGSGDVFVNGKPVMRQGDTYAPHGCVAHAVHGRAQASGSGTVFANGKPIARIGDGINCGGAATSGSGDVFADDHG